MIQLKGYRATGFERGVPRMVEAIWFLTRLVFFYTPVPWPSPLRVGLLRLFGAQIGQGVVIRSQVNITFPWRLEIGDYSWIGEEVLILSLAPVQIGSNCCLSQRSFLCTGSHNHRTESFDLITRPITVGDGCWIGASAFVGPGVTLHPSTVCAAGAVVVKDAGPNQVVGGNPAKPLGH